LLQFPTKVFPQLIKFVPAAVYEDADAVPVNECGKIKEFILVVLFSENKCDGRRRARGYR